jgi:hypothetical protein
MSNKQPILISPTATAAFAWVDKPDTAFVKTDTDKAKYKLTLLLPKEGLGEGRLDYGSTAVPGDAWVQHILNLAQEHGIESDPKESGCPVHDGDGYRNQKGKRIQREEQAGCWVINATTTFKPEGMDTKGGELPEGLTVYSGDTVKAAIKPNISNDYFGFYLTSVMLVKKNAERKSTVGMFGDVDGFVAEDEDFEQSVDFGGEDDTSGDF